MISPWIENYRGEWENSEGFVIAIRPIDERTALVDLSFNGRAILRPWCGDSPSENLNGLYREGEGGGLEVTLGRDGFSLVLDYESAGFMYDREIVTAGVSRYEDDEDAEEWVSLLGLETYFRREPKKTTN